MSPDKFSVFCNVLLEQHREMEEKLLIQCQSLIQAFFKCEKKMFLQSIQHVLEKELANRLAAQESSQKCTICSKKFAKWSLESKSRSVVTKSMKEHSDPLSVSAESQINANTSGNTPESEDVFAHEPSDLTSNASSGEIYEYESTEIMPDIECNIKSENFDHEMINAYDTSTHQINVLVPLSESQTTESLISIIHNANEQPSASSTEQKTTPLYQSSALQNKRTPGLKFNRLRQRTVKCFTGKENTELLKIWASQDIQLKFKRVRPLSTIWDHIADLLYEAGAKKRGPQKFPRRSGTQVLNRFKNMKKIYSAIKNKHSAGDDTTERDKNFPYFNIFDTILGGSHSFDSYFVSDLINGDSVEDEQATIENNSTDRPLVDMSRVIIGMKQIAEAHFDKTESIARLNN